MSETMDNTPRGRRSFSGSYERAVDPKGRFNLPFRFRRDEDGADDWVVTLGVEHSLSVYPAEVWDEVFRRAKEAATTARTQAMLRHVSANTFDLAPDAQGRVMVPVEMLRGVDVTKRVLVVGMGDHLELWDKDVYTAHQQENLQLDQDYLRQFFS